jgi:hypothetical protein
MLVFLFRFAVAKGKWKCSRRQGKVPPRRAFVGKAPNGPVEAYVWVRVKTISSHLLILSKEESAAAAEVQAVRSLYLDELLEYIFHKNIYFYHLERI